MEAKDEDVKLEAKDEDVKTAVIDKSWTGGWNNDWNNHWTGGWTNQMGGYSKWGQQSHEKRDWFLIMTIVSFLVSKMDACKEFCF